LALRQKHQTGKKYGYTQAKKKHVHQAPAHVTLFINAHKDAAQKVAEKYDIPASVILAQSAIESQWGQKAPENAYFGIKGKSPTGATVNIATHEDTAQGHVAIRDDFRAYASYDEAADDYGAVITTNKNFSGALLHRKDPSKFADAVAKKYATDPKYAAKIKSVIKTNHLDQYDKK
jgi:flagellar protein FlgJ